MQTFSEHEIFPRICLPNLGIPLNTNTVQIQSIGVSRFLEIFAAGETELNPRDRNEDGPNRDETGKRRDKEESGTSLLSSFFFLRSEFFPPSRSFALIKGVLNKS